MFADHMLPDIDELVATFFRERMVEYVDAYELPTTYSDFRRELESFVAQTSLVVSDNQLNNALRSINISQEKVCVCVAAQARCHQSPESLCEALRHRACRRRWHCGREEVDPPATRWFRPAAARRRLRVPPQGCAGRA